MLSRGYLLGKLIIQVSLLIFLLIFFSCGVFEEVDDSTSPQGVSDADPENKLVITTDNTFYLNFGIKKTQL